jgi:polyhydroxyalkanoate synthesis repressor PhaR
VNETSDPVVIKRYASRKLYDAAAKDYVTLEDIARYIRQGREVQIVDNKTGEDLTRQYLVQIIADFESQGEAGLPLNVLTDLVRHYQDQASAMTPAFLSQMFEAFREQQEKVMEEIGDLRNRAFDPGAAMNAVQEWQAKQSEFFRKAMQGWVPGNEPDEKQQGDEPAPSPKPDGRKSGSAKIAEIEANLKALQEQLKKLK